jgi:hypothetical protein
MESDPEGCGELTMLINLTEESTLLLFLGTLCSTFEQLQNLVIIDIYDSIASSTSFKKDLITSTNKGYHVNIISGNYSLNICMN